MPSMMKLMLNSKDETHYFIRNLAISVRFEEQQVTIHTGDASLVCKKQ